jgi:WD repeat-containing protein 26
MEAPEVSEFRQYILDANWVDAEAALIRLGVTENEGLWASLCLCAGPCLLISWDLQEAKFLIGQQKYLELLEDQNTILALHVLRHELAPLNTASDQLHSLTKYACMRNIHRRDNADIFAL